MIARHWTHNPSNDPPPEPISCSLSAHLNACAASAGCSPISPSTLRPHTLLEVRGANGSGKTSLLRMLCGLLAPAAGSIAWNGSDIRTAREEYRRTARLHRSSQRHQGRPVTRLKISHSRRASPACCSTGDARRRTASHAASTAFQHAPCRTLSQGQRRRIALARLLSERDRARYGYWMSRSPRSTPPRSRSRKSCSKRICRQAACSC